MEAEHSEHAVRREQKLLLTNNLSVVQIIHVPAAESHAITAARVKYNFPSNWRFAQRMLAPEEIIGNLLFERRGEEPWHSVLLADLLIKIKKLRRQLAAAVSATVGGELLLAQVRAVRESRLNVCEQNSIVER